MKLITSIILIFAVARCCGQVQFNIAPDFYFKGSLSSDHPFRQESEVYNNSDFFEYETKNFSWKFPFNIGISAGITIKNRHEIIFGVNSDGCADHTIIRFETLSDFNYSTPNSIETIGKASFTRYFLNYKYSIFSKSKKTNLSILGGIGLVQRVGVNSWGLPVGSFGSSNSVLNKQGVLLDRENASFTGKKRGVLFNLGLSSDLIFKEKYWFTLSAVYSIAPVHIGFTVNSIRVYHPNGSIDKTWKHTIYNKASGLYIGISRQFQLYPWIVKKKDKKKKKRNKS